MKKTNSLGEFEQVVLTAVLTLGDRAYGVTIHDKVCELAAPKPVKLGSIYITLERLTDKGYLTSWLAEPTPERGGRSKRFYRLQPAGEQVLRDSAETAKRIYEAVEESWRFGRWKPTRAK